MAKLTIEIQTTSDGMGDGWIDPVAANETYAEWLQDKISEWCEKRFPMLDWQVEIYVAALNQSGSRSPQVYGDEFDADGFPVNHENIAYEVHTVAQNLWGEFCSIAIDEFGHLVVPS